MSKPITVKTLRELDALVAEHVMQLEASYIAKGYPAGCIKRNPSAIPQYSTWEGVEAVIKNREQAGCWVCINGGSSDLGLNPNNPDAAFMPKGSTRESGYAAGPTIPIAVCLAALASIDVAVKLELGDRL